jgi:hypothetical protein
MRDYPYWGGMTDTRELPACQIGAPIHEVPTSMILFTDTRPDPAPDPCADCGHPLRRHAAQEGMCLDCQCHGWTAPAVPARPRRTLRAAARTAYTTLITLGVMTLTGCAAVGPDGLADAVAQVLR